MRSILITIVANGLALVAAAWLLTGITLGGQGWAETAVTAALVAVVLGLVNAIVKPVVRFLSLPLIWLTLGLFTLVVNAAMLLLTSWVSGRLGLAFHVDGLFWSGILGGLVISLVTTVVDAVLGKDRERPAVPARQS